MIRTFLFDIGNVLVRFDFSKAVRALAALSDVSDESEVLARIETVKIAYEDGQLPRTDFIREIISILKYRGTETELVAAWQDIFTANEPMHDLVRKLHANFPLYLLSNTSDIHVEGLFRDFDIFRNFTGATYSYVVRASKPHPPIYQIATLEHGLVPAETLFIDDLAANIATAKELGFQTHHYHPDRHHELLATLVTHGIA
jgi:putative hydrolase of the HAD superfamily